MGQRAGRWIGQKLGGKKRGWFARGGDLAKSCVPCILVPGSGGVWCPSGKKNDFRTTESKGKKLGVCVKH